MPANRNIKKIKIKKENQKYSIIILNTYANLPQLGVSSLIELKPKYTVLNHQLDSIKKRFNNYEVIMVTGLDAIQVLNECPNDICVVENEKYETTGHSRSLAIGLKACTTENIIVIYGDTVFNSYTLDTDFEVSKIFVKSDTTKQAVGCNVVKNHVEQMMFGINQNRWSQMFFVTGNELKLWRKFLYNRAKDNRYGFESLNYVMDNNGKFLADKPQGSSVVNIFSYADLQKAKKL